MLYAIVAVAALIADQVLKYWVTANIELGEGFKALIPGFIRLSNIHNSGAAFSIFEGIPPWIFVVLCILFVLVVVWLLIKDIIATPGARWAAVFVVAGALGNCVDRIISGYVVDMLEFEFVRFPVFNLADIYITVGAVVFCIFLLLEKPAPAGGKASRSASGAASQVEVKAEDGAQKPGKARNAGYVHTPYVPPTPAPRRPEPPPFDPENPFAEWEVQSAPAQPASAPASPAAPDQPEAAAQPAPTPEQVESFDLEDILSEFEDRK